MRSLIPLTLFAALGLGAVAAAASEPQAPAKPAAPPPAAERPKPCTAPEHRQFDFWLGEWDVVEGGKVAGTNAITSTLGGCVLHEHWSGEGGLNGESFNLYDAPSGQWRQFWVDSSGSHLDLVGGLVDGKMVLSATTPRGDKVVHNRITWTPNADKSVRQLWEVSRDGQTWKVVFDGLYKPRSR